MALRRWKPGIDGNFWKGSADLQERQVGEIEIRGGDWESESRWDSRGDLLISRFGKEIWGKSICLGKRTRLSLIINTKSQDMGGQILVIINTKSKFIAYVRKGLQDCLVIIEDWKVRIFFL